MFLAIAIVATISTQALAQEKVVLDAATQTSAREDSLKRAKVWRDPEIAISAADLSKTPGADSFENDQMIECRWKWKYDSPPNGNTPKFNCDLPSGETIKVKYSPNKNKPNSEIFSEVLGARLMNALGFAADRMYAVKKVRCFGCPSDPWSDLKQLYRSDAVTRNEYITSHGKPIPGKEGSYDMTPNYEKYVDFEIVAIERKFGKEIKIQEKGGWKWAELTKIDSAQGASKAEIDALRLMSALIGHADNKGDNQTLACRGKLDKTNGKCAEPVAYIGDLGSTFSSGFGTFDYSPIDVERWKRTSFWKNPSGCQLHVDGSPNSSFADPTVGEDGRKMLLGLLKQLSAEQIRGLFSGANLQLAYAGKPNANPDAWVEAMNAKIKMLESRTCN